MTETTQDSWKHKVPSMLLAQVTAYVLLIAATVIPTPCLMPSLQEWLPLPWPAGASCLILAP